MCVRVSVVADVNHSVTFDTFAGHAQRDREKTNTIDVCPKQTTSHSRSSYTYMMLVSNVSASAFRCIQCKNVTFACSPPKSMLSPSPPKLNHDLYVFHTCDINWLPTINYTFSHNIYHGYINRIAHHSLHTTLWYWAGEILSIWILRRAPISVSRHIVSARRSACVLDVCVCVYCAARAFCLTVGIFHLCSPRILHTYIVAMH